VKKLPVDFKGKISIIKIKINGVIIVSFIKNDFNIKYKKIKIIKSNPKIPKSANISK
tara:strand:- start:69 stop:239 length:171 start_codon:yes stop_codon:yes gene_type:complete